MACRMRQLSLWFWPTKVCMANGKTGIKNLRIEIGDEKMRKKWQGLWKGKWSKGLAGLMMCMTLATALTACGKDGNSGEGEDTSAGGNQYSGHGESRPEAEPDRHHVEITIKDYGTISVELYGEVAPMTVENFLKLAEDGFYDGLTFHRIVEGFMMQGGDPEGTGYGGSDETIIGEFRSNNRINDLSHTRGAISMARSNDFDSASSQFFIVHQDSVYLDGEYACFGYVTDGMDVVDSICESVPIVEGTDGFVAKEDQPVIESIKVID